MLNNLILFKGIRLIRILIVNFENKKIDNMESSQEIAPIPEEFRDIAPYTDKEFKEKARMLVDQPDFRQAVMYINPQLDYEQFKSQLLSVKNQHEFQTTVMYGMLQYLEQATTDGISIDGLENIDPNKNYTFITNHRDIVLDASFLNLGFIRKGYPVTQVAIGNNLLIFDWISDLVKLNRSFIVKRDVKMVEALNAAKQLSAYIHYTINSRHESVWIAQREGRAKDSNDLTQESLIKMLSLAGDGDTRSNLLQINLCPVSISYEYDPNDYLKAREFMFKKRNPKFKKSKQDDLFSMEIGLKKKKGRVTFRIGHCINDELEKFESDNRIEVIRKACRLIDNQIHSGYEIYPCNYISYDEVNHTNEFSSHYSDEDVKVFDAYINRQLDKMHVDDVTPEEREYMREKMLQMYAYPLKNKIESQFRQ